MNIEYPLTIIFVDLIIPFSFVIFYSNKIQMVKVNCKFISIGQDVWEGLKRKGIMAEQLISLGGTCDVLIIRGQMETISH